MLKFKFDGKRNSERKAKGAPEEAAIQDLAPNFSEREAGGGERERERSVTFLEHTLKIIQNNKISTKPNILLDSKCTRV